MNKGSQSVSVGTNVETIPCSSVLPRASMECIENVETEKYLRMSSGRRTMRPVRQLSLQQPGPRRQYIRRQRSAEDSDKSLQIYSTNPIARDRHSTNETGKPKVRIAWGNDRHGDYNSGLEQVEVVARQIPSRSRPTTGHKSSSRSYVVAAEKASILYSRQELAERLRLAWKHREKNRANIDIFLAHGFVVEERCDSELSTSVPSICLPNKETDFFIQDRKEIPWNSEAIDTREEARYVSGESRTDSSEVDREKGTGGIKNREPEAAFSRTMENDSVTRKNEEDIAESVEKEGGKFSNSDIEKKKKTRINIDCTSLQCAHPLITSPSLKMKSATIPIKIASDNFSTAKQKRASFHSGTNRAFFVPMIEKSAKEFVEADKHSTINKIVLTKSVETRCASADKIATQKQIMIEARSPIVDKNANLGKSSSAILSEKTRRTCSAPPQRRRESVTPAVTRMQNEKGVVERSERNLTKISRERSIRTSSVKKRSRNAKRHFLASSETSNKDEEDARSRDRCGGRAKISVDPRTTTDVVTMVSLVSSADSDSDAESSLRDDKLINELRSKLPTTPIIKTPVKSIPGVTRKPIKSVSFQRDSSSDESSTRNMSHTMREEKRTISVQSACLGFVENEGKPSWRQQDASNGIVMPPSVSTLLIQNTEETVSEAVPLTDREKRCLAVPIGNLHDDKKRKLLRTRSALNHPIVLEQTNNIASMDTKEQRLHLVASLPPPIDDPLEKVKQYAKETLFVKEMPPREVTLPSEPRFQSIKEKECWHLYKRICDKGVCVSFDTVLRGMLTPTEYRLRQKKLSHDLEQDT